MEKSQGGNVFDVAAPRPMQGSGIDARSRMKTVGVIHRSDPWQLQVLNSEPRGAKFIALSSRFAGGTVIGAMRTSPSSKTGLDRDIMPVSSFQKG